MIILWVIAIVISLFVGVAGFTEKGLPLSKGKYIKGKTGRIIGTVCIAFGIFLLVLFLLLVYRLYQ